MPPSLFKSDQSFRNDSNLKTACHFRIIKRKRFFKVSLSWFEEAVAAHGRWHASPKDIINKKMALRLQHQEF